MKKLVLAIAVGMVCVGAMAQGRVTFINTSRLVYLQGGQVYSGGVVPEVGSALAADLYVGSTAESLIYSGISQLNWSTTSPGLISTLNANLPSPFVGGSTASPATKWYFQMVVRPVTEVPTAGSALALREGTAGYGYGQVFQAFASTSGVSANNLTQTFSPVFSTWLAGTAAVTGAVAGQELRGALMVAVPEPASFALAGLGAAALLIFRRRN